MKYFFPLTILFGCLTICSWAMETRDQTDLLEKIAKVPPIKADSEPIPGFTAYGGQWYLENVDGEPAVRVAGSDGWRLTSDDERIAQLERGTFSCEMFIAEKYAGFSGIGFKVSDSGSGADNYNGYELGLNPAAGTVLFGAHRHNFTPLATIPFDIPVGRWFPLEVKIDSDSFSVTIDSRPVGSFQEQNMAEDDPLRRGTVTLRSWQYPIKYRRLVVTPEGEEPIALLAGSEPAPQTQEVPETLALDDLPPIVVLARMPLGHPNSVGTDIWQSKPTAPGAEIRIIDPAHPEEPTSVPFADPEGAVYDIDLSYDAKTIFFSYRKFDQEYWHLWRVGVDGTGLTQLTDGPFHDISPCQLPDGNLIFVSTRRFGHTVCQPGPASNLFTIDLAPDGGALPETIRCVSMNSLSDFNPHVLPDGRVLFTRWEYVDRDLTYRQSLWTQNPDGSAYQLYFGNTIRDVGSFLQARPFPGSDSSRVAAAFTPHHNWPHGAIGVIDRRFGVEGEKNEGFTYWSKEIPSVQDAAQEWGYRDPFPIADDALLCAMGFDSTTVFPLGEAPDHRFKIWLLDDQGNRRLVYEDQKFSCCQPILLEERPVPAVIPPRADRLLSVVLRPNLTADQIFARLQTSGQVSADPSGAQRAEWGIPELLITPDTEGSKGQFRDPAAVVVLVDVYNGLLPTIERGRVKKLRIMEQVRKSEDLDKRAYDQSPVMGYGTYYAKRCWGEVPVEEDGSAHFYVPALREIYFQAIDAEGKELQRMTSAAQFMQGENISCMGCHEPRETVTTSPTTTAHRPVAARRAPDVPVLPSWWTEAMGRRTNRFLDTGIFDYPTMIQPVLDRYCAECHTGSDPAGGYDLSGDTTRYFSMSYDNLLGRSRSYRQCDMLTGELPEETAALGKPLVQFHWLLFTPSSVNQPLQSGIYASRLGDYFTEEHTGHKIPEADKQKVWFWVDADVPYYGTFANSRPAVYGKRDLWMKPDENTPAPWLADELLPVYNRLCASCHKQLDEPEFVLAPQETRQVNWAGKFAWINLTHPENSPLLSAHLAREAGGRGKGVDPQKADSLLFRSRDNEDYQTMLEAIRHGSAEAAKRPRADQAGFPGRPEP
ncbi:MAG: hypothetical protein IJH68_05850 [Thermoguttaceae bacterium]|nr:hypothetical protein [Thermoguttaceae bacterium]